MRVAVVSPFVDRRHGTERALAELLERLARNYGCEIHLYAQRVEGLALSDRNAARSSESGAIFWHKVPSIPGPHVVQFLAWIFFNGLLRRIDTSLRGWSFDLVLSPGINCLHANVVIVHALFHRLQELSREESAALSRRASFFRRLHRRVYYGILTGLERRVYKDARVSLAAVSQHTAGLLAQYFNRRDVRVIPNGVDATQFCPAARLTLRAEARRRRNFRDGDFVLLLIGNDWRVKGLPTILEAMAGLQDVPLHLVVAGSDAPESFRETAKRLGVRERCHWELPRRDVLDLYAAADLYVSPSHEDSFGLPVAEAMACGLPVITSVFAGVSGLIRDGVDGFVLKDPRDASTLAKLVQHLHADAELRRRIGEAAAKTALSWSWDHNAEAVWALLKDASARKHSSHAMHGEP